MKALFFDLDGTLLTSRKTISPLTRSALEACRKRGVKLFLATARPPLLSGMLSWDAETLSLFEGGVYYNGGGILAGRYREYRAVSEELLSQVAALALREEALNVALQLEGERHAFRYPLAESALPAWGITSGELLFLENVQGLRTVKLLLFTENLIDSVTPINPRLAGEAETLCRGRAQFYLSDHGKTIQIMGLGVNKLSGIRRLCERYGYQEGEIAVFGDDTNDLEMLAAFPNSFAMGNADAPVRDAAGYTLPDNDSDGIAYAVTHLLDLG